MEKSPRESPTKRTLTISESLSEGEIGEKRPRLDSQNSDTLVQNEVKVDEVFSDFIHAKQGTEARASTEVIYELSSDNDESLLSVSESKNPSHQSTPRKSVQNEENNKLDEKKKDEISEGEKSEGNKAEKEQGTNEGIGDSSSSEDNDDDNNQERKEQDKESIQDTRRPIEENFRPEVVDMSLDESDGSEVVEEKPDVRQAVEEVSENETSDDKSPDIKDSKSEKVEQKEEIVTDSSEDEEDEEEEEEEGEEEEEDDDEKEEQEEEEQKSKGKQQGTDIKQEIESSEEEEDDQDEEEEEEEEEEEKEKKEEKEEEKVKIEESKTKANKPDSGAHEERYDDKTSKDKRKPIEEGTVKIRKKQDLTEIKDKRRKRDKERAVDSDEEDKASVPKKGHKKEVLKAASSDSSSEDETEPKKSRQWKKDDHVDGSRAFGKSADYSKKSVEDLEDLQEDIHKELAQISGKSLHKRKHKKTSSSSHREKRHKEKSTSRHKGKEKDRQRTSEARGDSRKTYEKNYEKSRKHHDVDEKPWSHDSHESWRSRPQKDERRPRNEKAGWTHAGRPERPPSRTEIKNNSSRRDGKVTRIVTLGEKKSKETEPTLTRNETAKNEGKKGLISDSMREMIRESMKDRRGFSREVVEQDSEDSDEPKGFMDGKMSDVTPPSSSDDEPEEESSPEVPKLPPYLPAIQGCRSVEEFQWLNRIEEGTYGVVYRAKDKRTGEVVALKKLKMEKEKEGFPITSLREINTLLKSQHPNIVTVREIVVGSNMDKIYIVMDFVEHDLKALMETMEQPFLAGEIKTIMIQLLRAVSHLHDNWILHRDIKTSNLLLSNKGMLKVGDFGLAREYGSPLKPYTPVVVTLWYRAPELLLGAKEYSTPIDLWSVGCVFAELLTRKPLFNGQSEISQINKIFKELGTPSDKIWPGPPAYSEYPATKKMTFAEYPYNNLRNKIGGTTLTNNGYDLLNSFLTYDPKRRITAESALKHEYFKETPSPVDPSMFPSWPARSEGAKRAKKASPKAPEGGNFYKTLSGDGDGMFHIPGKTQGASAVTSFTLKF